MTDEWKWSIPWHLQTAPGDVPAVLVEAVRRAVDLRDALAVGEGPTSESSQADSDGLAVRATMLVDSLNGVLKQVLEPALRESTAITDYCQAPAWEVVAILRAEGSLSGLT